MASLAFRMFTRKVGSGVSPEYLLRRLRGVFLLLFSKCNLVEN